MFAAARLEKIIDEAWEKRSELQPGWDTRLEAAIDETLNALDSGRIRVAEKIGGAWQMHQWIKKAVRACLSVCARIWPSKAGLRVGYGGTKCPQNSPARLAPI